MTASGDGTAKMWKAPQKAVSILRTHANRVNRVEFFPDSNRLLTQSMDGRVEIWGLDGELLPSRLAKETQIKHVKLSPAGIHIITAAVDQNTIKLWNKDGEFLKTLRGHNAPVEDFEFSPDGQYILSASKAQNAIIWDKAGHLFPICKPYAGKIQSARFLPDGSGILAFCKDGKFRIRDLNGQLVVSCGTILKENHGPAKLTTGFSPDRQRFAVASEDGTVKIWRTASGIFHYLKSTELYRFNSEDYSRYGIEWMR